MPNSMCARGALLRQFVVQSHGFQFTSERRAKPGMVGMAPGDNLSLALFTKYMPFAGSASSGRRGGGRRRGLRCRDTMAASQAGGASCQQKQARCHEPAVYRRCQLTCGLCTAAASRAALSSVLWIAYLSSYQHMGRAMASCTGGCACGPVEIDAHAPSERTSITTVQRLIVTHVETGGSCLLTLTILPSTSSGEFKWKLIGLLLGENAAGDKWLPPGAIRDLASKSARVFFPGVDQRLPATTQVRDV